MSEATEPPDRSKLLSAYARVRARTERLAAPLHTEDQVVQTSPDVSPTKWHLAHTTWFYETFLLERHLPGYEVHHPRYRVLFNSYYNAVGPQFHRPSRGHLSRPTVREVQAYRVAIDGGMERLLLGADPTLLPALRRLLDVGLNHEQQHQELLLTDIKHVLASNPLHPAYDVAPEQPPATACAAPWVELPAQRCTVGSEGGCFHFDNELPRHRAWLEDFAISPSLLSNAEYLEFIEDGGYGTASLWLSDGWAAVQREGWCAPLYWERDGARWVHGTLHGLRPLDPHAPVCHVSYFEAEAFARWAGKRLPTEFEWEVAAQRCDEQPQRGTLQEDGVFHPVGRAVADPALIRHLRGEVWEWTASAYLPYRGYRPAPGAIGEYNGKFMSGQMVLRGGSCATPADHLRLSYRNFFQPEKRWQFTGLRLADDR